jgi:hypothetical protein
MYVVDRRNNRAAWFSSTGFHVGRFDGSGTLPLEGKAAGGDGVPEKKDTDRFFEPEGIAGDNACPLHEMPTGTSLSSGNYQDLEEPGPLSGDV